MVTDGNGLTLRESHLAWGREWLSRDAAAIIARYAPEAVLFVPGEPVSQGRDQFAGFITEILLNPNFSLAWAADKVVVSADGTIGYVSGRYVQHNPRSDAEGFDIETGHYVTTYRRDGSKWLAVAEINTPGPIATREGLPADAFVASAVPAATSHTAEERSNISTIRRHIIDFWQEGNVALGTELYAADFVDHNPAPDTVPGLAAIVDFVGNMHTGFSRQQYDIVHLEAKGNLVFDHWTLRAVHSGEFLGVAPTGREVEFSGTDVFRMKDGKISEIWHIEEIARLMEQISSGTAPAAK